MYVQKADYKGRISTDLLDILISEDPDKIIADASKAAEDTIASLAGVLYNVTDEFAKTDMERNHFLLKMALSIALYNIYQISDDEQIPEKVVKNYDDTVDDLTKISIGKMSLSLPAKTTGDTSGNGSGGEGVSTSGTGIRRMGSQEKRTHMP